ncbi:MAG: copper transporter [Coriobacteriia bacterium]|nr:copper transporter [Coriobacteriia bacterium]
MYNMRYHLASLIAVFLALSIGLLLGGLIAESTPETVHNAIVEDIQRDIAQTRETNERLLADNVVAFDFADMLLDDFVTDKLEGHEVLILGEEGQELQLAISGLEAAGATIIHATPEFDEVNNAWAVQYADGVQEAKYDGIVNVFQPESEASEFLSDYFVFLRETQSYYEVPLIFATVDDAEGELISYAWEEGFSGTNQLGNRYGTYTLVVLLASMTEGKYGTTADAIALYPPVPDSFVSSEDTQVAGQEDGALGETDQTTEE